MSNSSTGNGGAVSLTKTDVGKIVDASTKEAIDRIMNAAQKKPERSYSHVTVTRGQQAQITLPLDMSLDDGIEWLERQKKAEERVVSFTREYDAYPLDGAHALKVALERVYGFADLISQQSMFGEVPPKKIEIDLGHGEKVVVPWGPIQPSGLKGVLTPDYELKPKMKFMLNCKVRAKDEEAMRAIMDIVQVILQHESLYRGKAFKLNFAWQDLDQVNPLQMQPKMLTLDGMSLDKMVLNETTKAQLETDLMLRLTMPEQCREAGVPLKQGILLSGPYGTGKTLAAKAAGNTAIQNGWTFIYLEDVKRFADAVDLAAHYAPAVVFVEDIDNITSGDRDQHMNEILNTIDGIDTKHLPIITVLTTNHDERIQKGFLRAGRIDSLIQFDEPGPDQIWQFIEIYLGDLVDIEEHEREPIIETMRGMVPAFIAEVCRKATMRAMWRLKRAPQKGEVQQNDLLVAALGMVQHAKKADEFGLIEKAREQVDLDGLLYEEDE